MAGWQYFVTVQRPTVVTHALGPLRLTSSEPSELVVARSTRLEVYRLDDTRQGLELLCSTPVNGKVAVLRQVSQPAAFRDWILLYTVKRQLLLMRYDDQSRCFLTVATRSLNEDWAANVDHEPLCACDPGGRVVALRWQEGKLQFADVGKMSKPIQRKIGEAVSRSQTVKMFSAGMPDCQIVNMAFMHTSLKRNTNDATLPFKRLRAADAGDINHTSPGSQPKLMLLCQHRCGRRFVSLWRVDADNERLLPMAKADWSCGAVPTNSTHIEAVQLPLGGVLVLGGAAASYHDPTGKRVAKTLGGPLDVAALALVFGAQSRWIVGAADGGIWLLSLRLDNQQSLALLYEHVGLSAPSKAVACLQDGYFFVGSSVGDSRLMKLRRSPNYGQSKASVEETWTQLGPIVDFCIADTDNQGRSQVVTCSGVGNGSVRVVRIGIGVTEIAAIDDIGNVLGIWTLGGEGNMNVAPLVVLSYSGATRTLAFKAMPSTTDADDDAWELEHIIAPGFLRDEKSILISEAAGIVAQVTHSGVNAISRDSLLPLAKWAPPAASKIQVAVAVHSAGSLSLLLGCGGSEMTLLSVVNRAGRPTGLSALGRFQLGSEPSCISVRHDFLAVGMWDRSTQLLRLDVERAQVQCLCTDWLPSDTIPRSVAFIRLASVLHLLVGLADGRLVSYRVAEDTGELDQRTIVQLGTRPPQLHPFWSADGIEYVFATGDRPTVIHAQLHVAPKSSRAAYAAVNLWQIDHVALFGAEGAFGGCLAFISDNKLLLGSLEDIQRVHVRTIPLGETPSRICYQRRANVFAVACQASLPHEECASCRGLTPTWTEHARWTADDVDMSAGSNLSSVRILHGRTFDITQILTMARDEQVSSMCAAYLGGAECLVIGTTFMSTQEPMPSHGRVIVFAQRSASTSSSPAAPCGSFMKISELGVHGAVFNVLPFHGMLLGSVNNLVCIWEWDQNGQKLDLLCTHGASIIALHVQAMGEQILVGDLMRSVFVLKFNPGIFEFEEVAHDKDTLWTTAIAAVSDEVFLCTDDSHNLFALATRCSADEDGRDVGKRRAWLERIGQMHTGEFVNKMHKGALVSQPAAASARGAAADQPTGCSTRAASSDCAQTNASSRGYNLVSQVVWASVDGAIGLVATFLGEPDFARLSLIQDAVAREAPTLAGLSHNDWRDCWHEVRGSSAHKGVIDGDLLEMFLDLPRTAQQAVVDRVRQMGLVVDDVEALLREVQELSQLH